jgi:hypothetical protein
MTQTRALLVAAVEDGFIEVNQVEDGSAVWLRNQRPDVGTTFYKRLCLDDVTNSATIYWETAELSFNSKTFRTASSLQEWLGSHPHN